MKPNNPFLISGYYGPEFFCDREQEAGSILEALQNGRNVTLTAPRRMGKTGLIRQVFYRLKELQPDIATFYLDIYSKSLGDFVRLFAGTAGFRSAKSVEPYQPVCAKLPARVYF